MFLSSLPILPSIFLHCVVCCATDETGIGSLSIFPGGATASSPRSPSWPGRRSEDANAAVLALVMALVTWDYYVTAPWTRDGRVRVQVASVAALVSAPITE